MSAPVTGQRRGRRISMSNEEVDAFLAEERTCRMATSDPVRGPHITALWFVWQAGSIWVNSLTGSQRWTDLQRNPAVAILIDAGIGYQELRGIELRGSVEIVGEVPRVGDSVDALVEPERLFALKYRGVAEPVYDGKHGWLRMTPTRLVSWDFRKMPTSAG